MNTFSNQVTRALSDIGIERPEGVDFLTLHDIFRLMPKIGEKMGWSTTPIGTQYFYIFQNDCEYPLETLCARFREGDYEKAEQYLLDLLKEHARLK